MERVGETRRRSHARNDVPALANTADCKRRRRPSRDNDRDDSDDADDGEDDPKATGPRAAKMTASTSVAMNDDTRSFATVPQATAQALQDPRSRKVPSIPAGAGRKRKRATKGARHDNSIFARRGSRFDPKTVTWGRHQPKNHKRADARSWKEIANEIQVAPRLPSGSYAPRRQAHQGLEIKR